MKVGVYRVYYHTITEKDGRELSHTSPVIAMIAAEKTSQLLEALPKPDAGPMGTTVRNHIVQIDQKHKDVLLSPMKG